MENMDQDQDTQGQEQDIQDLFLETLRQQRVPVSVFLRNGIKLQGTIESSDRFVITLKNVITQAIFKHAISTVMPSRPVRLPVPGSNRPQSG